MDYSGVQTQFMNLEIVGAGVFFSFTSGFENFFIGWVCLPQSQKHKLWTYKTLKLVVLLLFHMRREILVSLDHQKMGLWSRLREKEKMKAMGLWIPGILFVSFLFRFKIQGMSWYFSFSVWLTLLSMTLSKYQGFNGKHRGKREKEKDLKG